MDMYLSDLLGGSKGQQTQDREGGHGSVYIVEDDEGSASSEYPTTYDAVACKSLGAWGPVV